MRRSGPNAERTRALAYGGVVCLFAVIGGIFLFLAEGRLAAEIVLASIGTLLAGEGIGLLVNWRGGADEVVDVVRGRTPVTESLVAMQLGKPWFIRGIGGTLALVMGTVFWWAATR